MTIEQYAVLDRESREQLSEWLYDRQTAYDILLWAQAHYGRPCVMTIRRVEIEEDEQ